MRKQRHLRRKLENTRQMLRRKYIRENDYEAASAIDDLGPVPVEGEMGDIIVDLVEIAADSGEFTADQLENLKDTADEELEIADEIESMEMAESRHYRRRPRRFENSRNFKKKAF